MDCFSINSLISIRISASSSLNKNSARVLPNSVFPTPVGPKKRNEPIGRLPSRSPERDNLMAFANLLTASSCPIRRLCMYSSIFISFSDSFSTSLVVGMPVHFATI